MTDVPVKDVRDEVYEDVDGLNWCDERDEAEDPAEKGCWRLKELGAWP